MKPKDVNKSNKNEIWSTLFGQHFSEYPLQKIKLGDSVRLSKYKYVFTGYEYLFKGYEANFVEDLSKIVKVIRGDLNVYELEDLEGEPIIRNVYEELSGVDKKGDVYKVEKILKRKKVRGKKMVLVK